MLENRSIPKPLLALGGAGSILVLLGLLGAQESHLAVSLPDRCRGPSQELLLSFAADSGVARALDKANATVTSPAELTATMVEQLQLSTPLRVSSYREGGHISVLLDSGAIASKAVQALAAEPAAQAAIGAVEFDDACSLRVRLDKAGALPSDAARAEIANALARAAHAPVAIDWSKWPAEVTVKVDFDSVGNDVLQGLRQRKDLIYGNRNERVRINMWLLGRHGSEGAS